nr:nickel import ATP-binding protein NikD [Rhizobium sp. T1473]
MTIKNLTVLARHGNDSQTLVSDLSLKVRPGRVLALVGASGSGKSMTCSAALGVLPPGVVQTSGSVALNGSTIEPQNLRGRRVASIMQNPRSAFNPVRTMRFHAEETLKALDRHGPDAQARIEATMLDVGLDDPRRVLDLHAFEMSGGMLQRMMIALALLTEAPYLFADEPTTDLDLVVQMRILDLMEQLVRQRGLGVLLVTHDMGVVARLADDVAVLDFGQLVEYAPVEQIFRAPQDIVTRMLVEAHLALYGMELT